MIPEAPRRKADGQLPAQARIPMRSRSGMCSAYWQSLSRAWGRIADVGLVPDWQDLCVGFVGPPFRQKLESHAEGGPACRPGDTATACTPTCRGEFCRPSWRPSWRCACRKPPFRFRTASEGVLVEFVHNWPKSHKFGRKHPKVCRHRQSRPAGQSLTDNLEESPVRNCLAGPRLELWWV